MQPLRVAVVTQESRVGAWVVEQARRRKGIEVVSTSAEAFVLVTPADEVPAGMGGVISPGWRAKPVAFVTYGAGDGAVEQLRSIFSELHVVMVGFTAAAFDTAAVAAMFEQVEWWGRALRDRRS
jgi:hypothetical protein